MLKGPQQSFDNNSVFVTLIAIRLLNAVIVRTFFQPDEYYQALEPAWNFTPGYSSAWITWEWTQHLRSAVHPAIFSTVYFVAKQSLLWVDGIAAVDAILIFAPKTLQACIAALGDYYTWKLSLKVYQEQQLALTTLCLTVLSPWQWFCSTRTFSNGLENTLTVAALYYWPSDQLTRRPLQGNSADTLSKVIEVELNNGTKNLRVSLLLAATAVVLRPTNILIWITLASAAVLSSREENLQSSPNPKGTNDTIKMDSSTLLSRLLLLLRESIVCGGSVLALSALIDRAYYGVWTLPALNFLYFNVIQSLAVFYGNNNWHYYLTEGYPLLLTTTLPFALSGLYRMLRKPPTDQHLNVESRLRARQLALVCVVLPGALSVLSHKEVRFIYPILGPLNVIASVPVLNFFGPIFQRNNQPPKEGKPTSLLTRTLLLTLLVSLNLIIAGYTSLVHNSGIIALPDYLRNEFRTHYLSNSNSPNTQPQNLTFAVFMPCHSLPWRSHLLNPPSKPTPGVQAWALTCEPPLHLTSPSDKRSYLDEADIFYANPAAWIRKNMSRRPPRDFHPSNSYTNSKEPQGGIHAGRDEAQVNKFLYNTPPIHSDPSEPALSNSGLDITDLLPYLRTAPNQAALGTTKRRPWPHYLAFFAQLEPAMTQILRGSGYVECWRVFNSHWHDDWRRKGDVVVWCMFPERAVGGSGGRAGEQQEEELRRDVERVRMREREKRKGEMEDIVPEREGGQTIVRVG